MDSYNVIIEKGCGKVELLVKDKAFYKRLLLIGGPISAQQVITVGINLMDNLMLGQLDETALAASSIAVQVHTMFNYVCMGMGMGASVLIARYWGANDKDNLKKTLVLMYRCCLLIAIGFTLAVALMPENIMQLMTSDSEIIVEAVRYLEWALPCFILYGFSMTTTIVLRNCGKMNIPLYSSIGAFGINVFFNWVFIFGKLGAPEMGIAGAALGTLISRIFEFVVICGYFVLREKSIDFNVKDMWMPCGGLLGEYMKFSVPVMISDTILGLGNSAVMAVGGHIGKTFMSANTITMVVQHMATIFSSGLGQASLIITGNTLGEGRIEQAKKQSVSLVTVSVIFGIAVGMFIYLISPVIVGFYKIMPETREMAIALMHALAVVGIFMMPGSILTKGVLRGGGDTTFLMMADVIFLWAVSVPLGAAAGIVWHWPPFWIMFCLRIDNILKTILCIFRMRSGKWIKKFKTEK